MPRPGGLGLRLGLPSTATEPSTPSTSSTPSTIPANTISTKIIELHPSSSDFIIDFVNRRLRDRIIVDDDEGVDSDILKFSNKMEEYLNKLSDKQFNMLVSCRDGENKHKSCLLISPFTIKSDDGSSSKGSFGSITRLGVERKDTKNDASKLSFISVLEEIFPGNDFIFADITDKDDIVSKKILMSNAISTFVNNFINNKHQDELENAVYVFNPMEMMNFFITICVYELAMSMIAAQKGIGPKIYGAFMELSDKGDFEFELLMENLEPFKEDELESKRDEIVKLLREGVCFRLIHILEIL